MIADEVNADPFFEVFRVDPETPIKPTQLPDGTWEITYPFVCVKDDASGFKEAKGE